MTEETMDAIEEQIQDIQEEMACEEIEFNKILLKFYLEDEHTAFLYRHHGNAGVVTYRHWRLNADKLEFADYHDGGEYGDDDRRMYLEWKDCHSIQDIGGDVWTFECEHQQYWLQRVIVRLP